MSTTAYAIHEHAVPRDGATPLFTPLDLAGIVATIIMALGPLTAYALGF